MFLPKRMIKSELDINSDDYTYITKLNNLDQVNWASTQG